MILEEGLIRNPAVKIATESRREKRAAFQVYYPHPEGYDFSRLCGDVTALPVPYLQSPRNRVISRPAAQFNLFFAEPSEALR